MAMDVFFRDRDVKVLVVDPSGASRTLLLEVIRSQGFSDIIGVPNLKDAIGVMEVEKVRWLVTPMMVEQSENILQILNLFCTTPMLRELRISALVEETEMDLLPACFERGLLSYHKKPFTKDSLMNEFKELFARYEKYSWKSSQLAGSYLRQSLMHLGLYEELLGFERQLLKLSPGDLSQFINLSIPLAKMGKTEEAKSVLSQIKSIDSSFDSLIKQTIDTYLAGQDLSASDGKAMNILGLKSAVVVDGDSAVRNEVMAALQQMGVESISGFEDGEAAHEHIKANPDPDIVLMEWRIPKLTGPLFLQRAKEEGAKSTPFILISSLVQKEDIPFVREMGVAHVINKPCQKKELTKAIIWTVQQDRSPTEQGSMERKMRQLLRDRNVDEAAKIKERYVADATISQGSKEIMEAEFAYVAGDNEKARDFCIEAIKHAGESIFILNLLGKSLINLREFETALKCFQKAQTLAPLNLERLCQIAEIHSELGEVAKSNEILEEAKDIDPDSQRVDEAEAKIAINSGDSSLAKKIMGQLHAMENVVSYMNNRSVAMARCGMIHEGLEGYIKTLEAIPDNRLDIKGVIHYNMAFAHVRANQLAEAKQQLELSIAQKDSKVLLRAQSLQKSVAHAIQKGVQIHLAKSEAVSPPVAEGLKQVAGESSASTADRKMIDEGKEMAKDKVLAIVENIQGEMACHMIYKSHLDNSKLAKLLETTVRFNPRKAIERAITLGADKVASAGSN